jgi:hypothetical protein
MDQKDIEWLEARPFAVTQRAGHGRVWAHIDPAGFVIHAEEVLLPGPAGCVRVSLSYDVHPEFTCTAVDAETAFHGLFCELIDEGHLTAANSVNAIMHPDDAEVYDA